MTRTFDVRTEKDRPVVRIKFANTDSKEGYIQADIIIPDKVVGGICISDTASSVRIYGKQHAEYLIKALEKAIELKWLV